MCEWRVRLAGYFAFLALFVGLAVGPFMISGLLGYHKPTPVIVSPIDPIKTHPPTILPPPVNLNPGVNGLRHKPLHHHAATQHHKAHRHHLVHRHHVIHRRGRCGAIQPTPDFCNW
jgi:hypothetical protein